ncbi:hypothetical protein ACE1AT_10420 [Pelatocladus sp. BLCC-F211]|uniref:hypothetical protein n=1 Tax=Pelatocladus sp. BLCC-F211 TaxID=3342752 RepID=UPI0035B78574
MDDDKKPFALLEKIAKSLGRLHSKQQFNTCFCRVGIAHPTIMDSVNKTLRDRT